MVDQSWWNRGEVQDFVATHPVTSELKCRFCSNKVSAVNKDGHETQCLLAWVARQEAQKRKQEVHRVGLKPVEISYKKNDKSLAKSRGGKMRSKNKSVNDKYQRQATPMRACPECGEVVRQTLMMGHLRNSCSKSRHAMKRKNMMSPRNFTNGIQGDDKTADLTDVLFASWPGKMSGAPMDSTYFWKVVESHFFSSDVLEKKRMEQLSKSLCGVKLEDMVKVSRRRPLQASDIHCRDTMRFERNMEDPQQPLVLKTCAHKCDFFMRASHCRCVSDPAAKPRIEICHNLECTKLITSQDVDSVLMHALDDFEADISVLIKNEENTAVGCRYSMRVVREGTMSQHVADNGTFASSFQHDALSTLVGFDMQANKLPLTNGKKLLISLTACDPVQEVSMEKPLESISQVTSIVQHPADTALTDGLTPAINLLMEHLKDTTEQNRYRIHMLYRKLQGNESDVRNFRLSAQVTDSHYREFAAWKLLCMSLLIGYKIEDQPEVDKKKIIESEEQEGCTEDEDSAIDDGTCVVCFDGQSPEVNPIIFCDRCELAVHQRCYGMAKVPSNEFICDRCLATREGLDPARDVFCQLCSLGDGAFKRTIDGKWVHVVCALWCPKVWIGNLLDLSDISLVGTTNQARFMNSVEEIGVRMKLASGGQHTTPKNDEHCDIPAIELGSLCMHCRVACGRTIQCCHPGCSTSFHPLCGWFDGLPMTVSLRDDRYLYAGGGAGLNFQLFCSSHLPDSYTVLNQLAQRRRRARFRIDSFFVMRNKENYNNDAKRHSDDESSLLSGSIVQAVLSVENKITSTVDDPNTTDWTDMTVCSACFEYCSPIVGDLVDVNMLHRRQFMIRCQYCNVYIHPECCISDIGSSATIFKSNWICERCTQTGGKEAPACVVCAKATDYMMPCIDPPAFTNQLNGQAYLDSKSALPATRPAPSGGQQLWLQAHQNMRRQQQGHINFDSSKHPPQLQGKGSNGISHLSSNRWIHVYCGKWQKAKTVKRHHMLCAYAPTLKSDGMASRCEFCDMKEGILANCAQCYRRFHPICAAQKKLYCARSNRTEWKFYCEAHPPHSAAFDATRQCWMTQEILGQLQDLRRSLERGRMLLEMSRQRDRQQKRLLTSCKLPLMEASIEMIVKRRPTAQMKKVYHDLTGETLIDVPHRTKAAPALPHNSRSRVRSSLRTAVRDRSTRATKRSSAQAAISSERSSKRCRTRADSGGLNRSDQSQRRSSRQKPVRFNQGNPDDEDVEGGDEDDEVEALKKVWANLAVPKEVDDFDLIVAERFSELVTVSALLSCLGEWGVKMVLLLFKRTSKCAKDRLRQQVVACVKQNHWNDVTYHHEILEKLTFKHPVMSLQ
ncbi:unnamed protein product [Peronospora effusa]|uniref:PHD-type domain-containing protein n=1 Tax=Peronospora effusa TaxID=542832 RepID=A0A3M6VHQ3_9STRA|nr:hypothetical protein DD238_005936 [Peronospora effusa]RQM12945.1 hypothetical protein DD237_006513 [Peronospora effusa]CAI5727472.1 unnamed protein product [Peronospora effusa]